MESLRGRCHYHRWQHYVVRFVLAVSVGSAAGNSNSAENDETDNADTDTPNLELLEFLGQFETDEGQWIDLDSLLNDDFSALLRAAEFPTAPNDTNNPNDNQ